jgi:hypothetical protein
MQFHFSAARNEAGGARSQNTRKKEMTMHGFIGEELSHHEKVVHKDKEYWVPRGNGQYFYEAIKAGKSVAEALDYAQNPFRVAC